jgi:methylenetetrahydrofolate reductase (NADPH)
MRTGFTMEPDIASRFVRPSPQDERRNIQAMLVGASLELSSRDPAEIDACADLLEPGTAVTISMPPGQTYHGIVALATRLKRAGFRPVPHVAARRIASRDALDEYLARAAGEASVDSALVIAGDSDRPSGPFDSSRALLESGLFQRHGVVRIGVAGYPEGHPKIAETALEAALTAKKVLARGAGLDLQVVTQFCFESEPILAWVAKMKRHGLPVRVGLPGPASLPRLLRFAMLCGIGNSVRALKAQPQAITRLLVEAGPEAVVRDIARPGDAAITGVHFFCFGGLLRTARWLRALREGRFELTPDGGFRVGAA